MPYQYQINYQNFPPYYQNQIVSIQSLLFIFLFITKWLSEYQCQGLQQSKYNRKNRWYEIYEKYQKKSIVRVGYWAGEVMLYMINPLYVYVCLLNFICKLKNIKNANINSLHIPQLLLKYPSQLINLLLSLSILFLSIKLNTSIFYFFLSHLHPSYPFNSLHNNSIFFTTLFSPSYNLIWILYSHMFNRYLMVYQVVVGVLMPVGMLVPLGSLRSVKYERKVVLMLFVSKFVSIRACEVDFLMFWVTVLVLKFIHRNITTINKHTRLSRTLFLISLVGSSLFMLIYKRLLYLYLTNWMVNIGYLFLFGIIAWLLMAVYVVESINVEIQQKQQQAEENKIIKQKKQKQQTKIYDENNIQKEQEKQQFELENLW